MGPVVTSWRWDRSDTSAIWPARGRPAAQGSANLVDEAVRERGVDVFLAGVAGRSFTRDYWQRIRPLLEPKAVVPTHYDNFFRPLGAEMEFVANVQLCELPEEIAAASRDFEVAALPRSDRQG